jgi:PAS domain S-box-containing protein
MSDRPQSSPRVALLDLLLPLAVGVAAGLLAALLLGRETSGAALASVGIAAGAAALMACAGRRASVNAFRTRQAEAAAAEESLREREVRLRRVVESGLEGIWSIDAEARTDLVNPRMAEMLGYEQDEMLGCSMLDFMDDRERAVAMANFDRRREGVSEVHEFRLRHKQGHDVWTRMVTGPIEDDEGNFIGALAMVTDITQEKESERIRDELELQLRHAQKMEAVGQLAGGVAHDFNNLLTVILGNTELLLRKVRREEDLSSRDDIVKSLGLLEQAGKRAATLTRQLLTFSRDRVVSTEVVDAGVLLVELAPMLRGMTGPRMEVELDVGDALGCVRGNRSQLEQVMLNLFLNARDALTPGGGLIRLVGRRVSLREEDLNGTELEPGDHVELRVVDDGPGMDEEMLARIFEPFFTTKPMGHGTGLGLATAFAITQQAGGHLLASSAPGEGATFRVLLPVCEADPTPEPARAPAPREDGGTILICEDEDLVREMTRQVLESHGYVVLEAGSGERALELEADEKGEIQLLLTDVVMPGMNGRELAEELRRRRPATAVLFSSGYTADVIDAHGIQAEGEGFLPKPYSPAELVDRVRDALGRRADAPRSL